MLEQFLPMLQDSIQTPVQPVLFRYREIHAEQHVHRAVIEPLAVHAELAAGVDQPVHHQQLQHLRPAHVFAAARQFPLPEPVQFQLPPQLAAQPAVTVWPRAPQLHFAQLDLDAIERIGGRRPVFREQA